MNLHAVRHHLRCGKKSNIPTCCVIWFTFAFMPVCRLATKIFGSRKVTKAQYWWIRVQNRCRPNPHYQLCPICLLSGKRNRLKLCGGPNRVNCLQCDADWDWGKP
jgi:hypothetical protein